MQQIGMPIAEEKTLGPGPVIEFLGLVLDFLQQLIIIPEKKRAEYLKQMDFMLLQHDSRQKVTVRGIQKLAGHVNFICQALPAGRPFLASLYRLTASPRGCQAGSHRTPEENQPGNSSRFAHVSAISSNQCINYRTFGTIFGSTCDISWFHSTVCGLSWSSALGFGCVFKTHWAHGHWADTTIFKQGIAPNITLLELYAIVTALELWAPQLQGMHIILWSDSSVTVGWLTRKQSPIPAAMQLICHITLTCLQFQIIIKAVHLKGALNQKSDWISRGHLHLLCKYYPYIDRDPTPLPSSLWPRFWTREQMLSMVQTAQYPGKKCPSAVKMEVMKCFFAIMTLQALGIKSPQKIVHFNSAKKLQVLVNFNLACHYGHLPLQIWFQTSQGFLGATGAIKLYSRNSQAAMVLFP